MYRIITVCIVFIFLSVRSFSQDIRLFLNNFLETIQSEHSLKDFFTDDWTFVYHKDDRCEGSTDGEIENLKSHQIDEIIKLQVKNDGNGWACEKKEPKTFELKFNLKEQLKIWDRLEISFINVKNDVVYLRGYGESDFLRIFIRKREGKLYITHLEYRSEDPG